MGKPVVLVHGAWTGAFVWREVREPLWARGHPVFTPTLTGLGERAHLANPDINVDTHVSDVLALLTCEGLDKVVLVGHSYGGVVVTAAADRAPQRIAHVVYLDALVPHPGESVEDMRHHQAAGSGWYPPPQLDAIDEAHWPRALAATGLSMQPPATFTQAVQFSGRPPTYARTYVRAGRRRPSPPYDRAARTAREDPLWCYREIDAGHDDMLRQVPELVGILTEAAGKDCP
jgi:pimeloyl-ACP methyl ester carboxylesterase